MASAASDWNAAFVVVAAVAVTIAALWRWRRNKFNFFKERGIPGPEPSLISGNFFQLWNQDTIKVLDEWSNTYGDIYGIFNGDAPFLMVKDLELLRRVFIKDFAMFVDRGDVWALMSANPEQRNSLSFAKADRWKFIRRFVSMAFTSAKLRPMMGNMSKAVDHFLDLLEARCRQAPDGEANAHPLLGCLAFELVAETACGLFLDVQHKPNDKYFDSAKSYTLNVVDSAYQRAGQFFSGLKGIVCLLERHFGHEPLVALAHRAVPIVAFREKDSSLARPDLLQTLLEAKVPEELLTKCEFRERPNAKGDFLMPVRHVASNAATILTAGFETVSANSSHCAFCLAKYPRSKKKSDKK
ncbi:cytochrome P450 3A11 [Rhipicephalus sanguineus]|uniref:cytochrome P450 3A11 n=1 Tax=Rhipicephalus sanguineus TaxID=34632 RepID=UPI00189355E9|nr:cytochrome P450 3A11 [Rhipicephalus sanguineus]